MPSPVSGGTPQRRGDGERVRPFWENVMRRTPSHLHDPEQGKRRLRGRRWATTPGHQSRGSLFSGTRSPTFLSTEENAAPAQRPLLQN